jgi:hypothetical protein
MSLAEVRPRNFILGDDSFVDQGIPIDAGKEAELKSAVSRGTSSVAPS